jgi:phosphate transport system protein
MLRESFIKHIKELEKYVSEMTDMVLLAVNRSVEALKSRDIEQAKKIIADDVLINQKRWEIEEHCINLIATQQPVASDLREIIAVLNIITDLERMGDYAEGIAKIVVLLGNEPLAKPLDTIPKMAQLAVDMLKRSITSFINRDAKTAAAICNEDDAVDALYDKVYEELIRCMIEDPRTITKATHLIWTAHNIERIADRVTNICERIVFLVTGSMKDKLNVSKY